MGKSGRCVCSHKRSLFLQGRSIQNPFTQNFAAHSVLLLSVVILCQGMMCSLFECMCVLVCIYVCLYAFLCVWLYVCTCMCICTRICVSMCVCMCICMSLYVCVCLCVCVSLSVCMYIYICIFSMLAMESTASQMLGRCSTFELHTQRPS